MDRVLSKVIETTARGVIVIPKNEMGVFYLFSRFHKELGFEEIVSFQQFPDLIALRNGKKVLVELEYKASNIKFHYGYWRSGPYGRKFIEGLYDFSTYPIDVIVCWKNDGIDLPIEVIELDSSMQNTPIPNPLSQAN